MSSKKWFITCVAGVFMGMVVVAGIIFYLDPYFHYHAPMTDRYYYTIENERSQNDGILRNFDYNAIVTGTSMSRNFKTTEVDLLWDVRSVKTTYSGTTLKEVHQALVRAFSAKKDIRIVIQSLDLLSLTYDKDEMRSDMGVYPLYLYNNNPFDDVGYLLNKDVLLNRCAYMLLGRITSAHQHGITSFDEYDNWMSMYEGKFGEEYVRADLETPGQLWENASTVLTEIEKTTIRESIEQNMCSLCRQHPETLFYYFFPPYSAAWWENESDGNYLDKWLEAEQTAIECLLPYDNVRLYCFDHLTGITGELSNYRDARHYAEWINSQLLEYMHEEKIGLLTTDNYMRYLEEQRVRYGR